MNRDILTRTGFGLAVLLGVAGCQAPVPLPPEKPGETVADVLLPGGSLVGRPDATARQLPGGEEAGYALFQRLTKGSSAVVPAPAVGEARRRADGSVVTYLPPTRETLPTVLVQVRDPSKGLVIRRIEFPADWKKDGGAGM